MNKKLRKALVDLRAHVSLYGFGGGDLPTEHEQQKRQQLLMEVEQVLDETKHVTNNQLQPFGIYHWDTFEEPGQDTIMVDEAFTLEAARIKVQERYGDRIHPDGADQIDIVDLKGVVWESYKVR